MGDPRDVTEVRAAGSTTRVDREAASAGIAAGVVPVGSPDVIGPADIRPSRLAAVSPTIGAVSTFRTTTRGAR